MNELLKKIYENVVYYEADTLNIEKRLEAEIHLLINSYAQKFTQDEMEIILNLMYAIQLKATQEGFQHGTKYTLSSLLALLSKS